MRLRDILLAAAFLVLFLASAYLDISWVVFEWRHPKANRTAFYRDFGSVVTWQKLDKYQ